MRNQVFLYFVVFCFVVLGGGVWEFCNVWSLRCGHLGTWGFLDLGIWGFRDLGVVGLSDFWILEDMDVGIQGSCDVWSWEVCDFSYCVFVDSWIY